MNVRECPFEGEILAEAMQSRWPKQADASLRAHVAQCGSCSEVAAIACSMATARQEEPTYNEIPEAGRVWWRAQLRARREAAKSAGRPITAAQVIAFACAAGLLGAYFGATSTWFQALVGNLTVAQWRWAPLLNSATGLIAEYGLWVLAAGAVLLLIPAAVYLTILRD